MLRGFSSSQEVGISLNRLLVKLYGVFDLPRLVLAARFLKQAGPDGCDLEDLGSLIDFLGSDEPSSHHCLEGPVLSHVRSA